jgi:threonine aldolase
MIDLRTDTLSLPSDEMRQHLAAAEVGDDYYGEDPSVARLEASCAALFGKDAALFTTSGMLANQLAIASQVGRGDEVITEYTYHLHLYESAQYASLCQVVLNARETADGVLRADDVRRMLISKPREPIYAQARLVAVENTICSRQGKVFPFDELKGLRALTAARGLALHLDGARLFNAHVATGIPLDAYAAQVDTLTVSFSKGLGAPFGSMLLGPAPVIARARALRVRYGSGFHQAGFCAAAAEMALRQMDRLAEDHRLARLLATCLRDGPFSVDPARVETNMVFLDLDRAGIEPDAFAAQCRARGLLVSLYPPCHARLVTCRNVDERDIRAAAAILHQVVTVGVAP